MGKAITKCIFNHDDCFAYRKSEVFGGMKGTCTALQTSAMRNNDCPFYQPETDRFNRYMIDAECQMYAKTHQAG